MEVEVITIELNQLQGMIANAVAKGIQLAKQQDVVEDTYISVGEAREMLGRATNGVAICSFVLRLRQNCI